ncbi:hypothetical protein [Dechloromonas sp. HYN0024]|uniref:hypothetical protein n=1 Tax=Dechloromonas sp. HYN0024 TaxID=2231055 RepID=UPI001F075FC6|nr:hypothetical protein [Dechloromonas sp. HYN0024]
METINKREAWNQGKLLGQKPPLTPKDIWAIRLHLQNAHAVRDLAMFNLAIDSKIAWLRSCQFAGARHHPREPGAIPCQGDAEKNAAASAVRTDGANKGSGVRLAGKISPAKRSVPVSK